MNGNRISNVIIFVIALLSSLVPVTPFSSISLNIHSRQLKRLNKWENKKDNVNSNKVKFGVENQAKLALSMSLVPACIRVNDIVYSKTVSSHFFSYNFEQNGNLHPSFANQFT